MRVLSVGSAFAILFVLGLAFFTGCSQQEKLYRVSGVVTYAGKPIPKGLIFFDPKTDGPQGFANIVEGKFDTAQQGRGVRGGIGICTGERELDGRNLSRPRWQAPARRN